MVENNFETSRENLGGFSQKPSKPDKTHTKTQMNGTNTIKHSYHT